jgi:hypothetical protein
MKKQRKHYTPEEKVAILRRHLLEQVPISELCDGTKGLGIDGLQLSLAGPVSAGVGEPALLKRNLSISSKT